MNANRPRESVLNLFDPLNSTTPSTPRRDVASPDSDKENSEPCPTNELTMTAFFNRTHKQTHSEPVVLKRRLIDVGDVTMDESSLHMLQDEKEEEEVDLDSDEDNTLTFRLMAAATPARPWGDTTEPVTPSSSSPRTPFAELALERVITPVVRTKVYRREILGHSSLSTINSVTPAPEDSALASVINAVNFSGVSFADSSSTKPLLKASTYVEDALPASGSEDAKENELVAPEITISLPDTLSNSMSTLHLATPIGTPLTDTTIPLLISPSPPPPSAQERPLESSLSQLVPPRLRPNPPNTSSHDPRRTSVDLYSSFNLQLQSPETTFDLLNDKILFCGGSPMDSFLNAMGEEESFDMEVEEANMERALERIGEEEVNKENALQSSPTVTVPTTKLESTNNTPESKPQAAVSSTPSPTSETTPQRSEQKTVRKQFCSGSGSGSPVSPTFGFGPSKANGLTKMISPSFRALSKATSSDTHRTTSTSTAPSALHINPPHIPMVSVFLPPSTKMTSDSPSTVASSSSISTVVPAAVPVPVPPVPALRIVKRTKTFSVEKPSLTSTASVPDAPESERPVPVPSAGFAGSTSSNHISRVQKPISLSSLAPIPVSVSEPALRQPVATTSAGVSQPARPSRMAVPLSSSSSSTLSNMDLFVNRFGPGPRRVPVVESQTNTGAKAGSGMANGRLGLGFPKSGPVVACAGASVGARRVIVASANGQLSSSGPPAGMGVVSGLKPLARYGNGAGGGSALSRPLSRLPAPASGRSGGTAIGTRAGSGQSHGGLPVLRRAYGQ